MSSGQIETRQRFRMKHERHADERRARNASAGDRIAPRSPSAPQMTPGRSKGVKPVERGHRMTGHIVRLWYGQGHGFIRADDRREMFFHYRDVAPRLFNALAVRDRVVFEVVEDVIAGPRAVKVRRATRSRKRR
jgi:cold shock CspA family protein